MPQNIRSVNEQTKNTQTDTQTHWHSIALEDRLNKVFPIFLSKIAPKIVILFIHAMQVDELISNTQLNVDKEEKVFQVLISTLTLLS